MGKRIIKDFALPAEESPQKEEKKSIVLATASSLKDPRLNAREKLLLACLGLQTVKKLKAATYHRVSEVTGIEGTIVSALIGETRRSMQRLGLESLEIKSLRHPENQQKRGFFVRAKEGVEIADPDDFNMQKEIENIEEEIQRMVAELSVLKENSGLQFPLNGDDMPSEEEMILIGQEVDRLTLEKGDSQRKMTDETKAILSIFRETTAQEIDVTPEYVRQKLTEKGVDMTLKEVANKISKIKDYLTKTGRISIFIASTISPTNKRDRGYHLRYKAKQESGEEECKLQPPILEMTEKEYDALEDLVSYAMEWSYAGSMTYATLKCFQQACMERKSLNPGYCRKYALEKGTGDIPEEQFYACMNNNTITAFRALGISILRSENNFQPLLPEDKHEKRNLIKAVKLYYKKPNQHGARILRERVMDSLRHMPSDTLNEERRFCMEIILKRSIKGHPISPKEIRDEMGEKASESVINAWIARLESLYESMPQAIGYRVERVRGRIKFVVMDEYERSEVDINNRKTAGTEDLLYGGIIDLEEFLKLMYERIGGISHKRRIPAISSNVAEFVARCTAGGKAVSSVYVKENLGVEGKPNTIRNKLTLFMKRHMPEYEVHSYKNNTFYIAKPLMVRLEAIASVTESMMKKRNKDVFVEQIAELKKRIKELSASIEKGMKTVEKMLKDAEKEEGIKPGKGTKSSKASVNIANDEDDDEDDSQRKKRVDTVSLFDEVDDDFYVNTGGVDDVKVYIQEITRQKRSKRIKGKTVMTNYFSEQSGSTLERLKREEEEAEQMIADRRAREMAAIRKQLGLE